MMMPDFLTIAVGDSRESTRELCIEICAHTFYGRGRCIVTFEQLDSLVVSFEALVESDESFELKFTRRGVVTIAGELLDGTDFLEIGASIEVPEGHAGTQFFAARNRVANFASQLRTASESPVSCKIELRAA